MEGVPGVSLFLEQPRLSELQGKVQDMCHWSMQGFPGCQPVSMDRKNIINLHTKPYKVSWKADGTRYMMLINDKNEIYFFDRNFSCFQVDNTSFPRKTNLHEHLKDTLLDGEMVIDEFKGHRFPRYLAYDIIYYDGIEMIEKTFDERLKCIFENVVGPRNEAFSKRITVRELEPFGVRGKEFWPITQSKSLLGEKFAKSLAHKPDGLIFQPSLDVSIFFLVAFFTEICSFQNVKSSSWNFKISNINFWLIFTRLCLKFNSVVFLLATFIFAIIL